MSFARSSPRGLSGSPDPNRQRAAGAPLGLSIPEENLGLSVSLIQ